MENNCKMKTLRKKLEVKYKFSELSGEQMEEIRKMYYAAHPGREFELRKKIFRLPPSSNN